MSEDPNHEDDRFRWQRSTTADPLGPSRFSWRPPAPSARALVASAGWVFLAAALVQAISPLVFDRGAIVEPSGWAEYRMRVDHTLILLAGLGLTLIAWAAPRPVWAWLAGGLAAALGVLVALADTWSLVAVLRADGTFGYMGPPLLLGVIGGPALALVAVGLMRAGATPGGPRG